MYGAKLKQIRKYLDYTQEKMAGLLNISVRTYTSYERNENKPSYSMLVELCKSQNVNLNWFIADIGEIFNPPQYENVADDILNEVRELLEKKGIR